MVNPPRFLVAGTLCAMALLPGNLSHAAGSPSPPPPPASDYTMGRAPQNCATSNGSLLHVAYNRQPDVFPHSYWWIGRGALAGYTDWVVQGRHVTLHFGPRTAYGYPQKVFWQLAHGSRGPVTVRGWNARTGQPVWFGRSLNRVGMRRIFARHVMQVTAGLQTVNLGPPTGRLVFRSLNELFVPAAGCYLIRARWKTGSWTLSFAAGCLADRRIQSTAQCR